MLKQRVITAIIFILVFLFSLFLAPKIIFNGFLVMLFAIALWEWANLSGISVLWQRIAYVSFSLGLSLLVIAFLGFSFLGLSLLRGGDEDWNQERVRQLFLISATWWSVAFLWVQGYPSSAILWGSCWMRIILGWLVLIPTLIAFVVLYNLSNGPLLILLLVAVVVATDAGAYFVGKRFGVRKLAALVSPGKTWEGFIGGILACAVLAGLVLTAIAMFLPVSLSEGFNQWLAGFSIILLAGLASVLGDLFESMLKRHRGIKDSGNLLPGHGGVLDRLDSLSAAAPIFTLGIIISDLMI